MKKVISLLLVMALTATAAIGGTVAYLTDRDSEANVFTVGDVSIDLTEDFEQGAELIPGVDIKKEAKITNTGKNDAWVWMTLAVPAALDSDAELGTENVLHWNMPGCFWYTYHNQDKYIKSGIAAGYLPEGSSGVADEDSWINNNTSVKETINGVDYNVYTFMYKGAIVPGETTNIALSKVYLDAAVDIDPNGDWYTVKDGVATELGWNSNTNGAPVVYVSAYAMQKEEFETVEAAYAAYNKQWTTTDGVNNGLEWGTAAQVVEVSNLDDVKAALENANGEPVIIDANGADLGDVDDVTFNDGSVLKDATFSGESNYGQNVNGTATFVGCTFASTKSYAAHFDGGNGEIVFIDCHFEGWNSFGTAITGLTFKNCTFGNNGNYGIVRVYQDATFENCTFESDLEGVDTNVTGTTVHFNNCTGIEGKIYNNADNVGNWFIDGTDVSSQVKSW